MIKASVCVTTYNRAPLLDRTLASLAAQTRQPDEVIVSDDCSTDATAAVVDKWRSVFPALVYRRNPFNLGMPGNLNACIAAASGEYVANLHDADEFDATLLQKWESALDRYPSAGFVFCGLSTGDSAVTAGARPRVIRLNRSTELHRYPRRTEYLHDAEPFTPGREFFERHFLHASYSIVFGTVMARRAVYRALLPFDPQFAEIADVDMWMRICRQFDVAYVREPLIHIDDSPTAWRAFSWGRIEGNRRMQRLNIERFYDASPKRLARELRSHTRLFRRSYLRTVVALAVRGYASLATEGIRLLLRPPARPCGG